MRTFITICAALIVSMAAALSLPNDADIFLTATDGTIVGVGRTVGGEAFELELLDGFEGFARLVMVTADGDTDVWEVMVRDGALFVDFVDLATIVRDAGFSDRRRFADGVGPAGAIGASTDAAGRERSAGDAADDAAEGAEGADGAEGVGGGIGPGTPRDAVPDGAGDAADDAANGRGDDGARDPDERADDAAEPVDEPGPPVDPADGPPGEPRRP